MSKITDYNDISQSYDSVREPADACILKSLMESLTGKCVKVIARNLIIEIWIFISTSMEGMNA